jgi:alkanesulfonate monooxygenase SsuD/methylene tetrahydromethanopterin reductase-like flavin-dependent oxidoreductase (luciferase family)
VVFQAGDSDAGREFAASAADAIFGRHSTLEPGQAFYTDVKRRLAKYGRAREDLLILPAATFVLGDTDAEAHELAREVRRAQVSGQTAIKFLEQLWNRDLSAYDPDGPLPEVDPDVSGDSISKGRAADRLYRDRIAVAGEWREEAAAKGFSIRDLMLEKAAWQSFIGSAETIATQIDELVQADAADGFILVPHITPGGLDGFADQVVPILQERGRFRTDYEGTTLRDHLGLSTPRSDRYPDQSAVVAAAGAAS